MREAAPELLLLLLRAQRRAHDVLRAVEAGLLVVVVGEEEVLRAGLGEGGQAAVARRRDLARAPRRPRGARCRPGTPATSASAIARCVASASSSAGRVSAWYLGAVLPPLQRLLDEHVDDRAVLGVHADRRAELARALQRAEDRRVVHEKTPGYAMNSLKEVTPSRTSAPISSRSAGVDSRMIMWKP